MTETAMSSYPPGVDFDAPLDTYATLVEMLEQSCKTYAPNICAECLGGSYTYAELDRRASDFASFLQQAGLDKGDRVAIMLPNIGQFGIASFGALRGGFVSVNVNPLYTARELRHQLQDSGAKAIVILENFAATLEEVIADTDVELVVITRMGDMLPALKRTLVNMVVKHLKKMVPGFDLPHAISFRASLAKGAQKPMNPVEIGPDDTAFIQYTGGTTGVAKGAILTQRNVVSNVLQGLAYNGSMLPVAGSRVVQPLPLYHIFALGMAALCMAQGYRQLLIPNPRDMKSFVKELKSKPFAMMPGVNTLFTGLMNTPGFADLDFSKVTAIFGGGTATLKDTSDRWQKITGKPIMEGYGLSETSPVLTGNHLTSEGFSGTVGHPYPGTLISLRNDDETEVADGEPGELCAKGPQVFQRYHNRPEETEKAFTKDGFFKTGDIAIRDDKGRYKIVDRKKDMIIVSGFNVFPTEIEGVVAQMQQVLECACIGVPSEKTGETPKLFVIKQDPDLTEAAIKAHCKENLTAYKRPTVIVFVENLPKSPVGKVLRKELR